MHPPERVPLAAAGECFCGDVATRTFRGWGLCEECGPRVERAWRRANPKMATSIKKPKR